MSDWTKFSISSRPMKPVPTMTAFLGRIIFYEGVELVMSVKFRKVK
jgi:hypothetical protein